MRKADDQSYKQSLSKSKNTISNYIASLSNEGIEIKYSKGNIPIESLHTEALYIIRGLILAAI